MTKRMPALTDEDRKKKSNPYFDHWENRDGVRTAIYKPILPGYIVEALDEMDGDKARNLKMAFTDGTQIWDPERRKTVSPTRWWIEWAEGKQESLDQLYMKSAWAYRCVGIRSESLSQTPYQVVDKSGESVDNSALGALLDEVNPECNWRELIGFTEADMCIYGSAYWLKIRRGAGGPPIYLQRLAPKAVEVIRGDEGIREFRYNSVKTIPRKDIVYFKTYNPHDELTGLSPLSVCKQSIRVDASANDTMVDFFDNHAMPAYIFSLDTEDINMLRSMTAAWQKEYGGKGNQGKTAFIGGKGVPKEMGYAPEKLALKDVREEARKAICSALGVPPVLVGAWEAANYATADEQRQSLYSETIMPRGEYMASVINADLAPELGEEKFEWEWDELSIMQEDEGKHAERLALLVEKNILKPEVAAEELGYDPSDVPEPAPVPDALKPFAQGAEEESSEEQDLDEELAKWQKKSLKRLREGKSPAVVFKSEVIPLNISNALLGALEACDSQDDVKRAFSKARVWRAYP